MRKLFLFLMLISTITFVSCSKDDEASSTLKVTVVQGTTPQAGVTVYLFKSQQGPGTGFFEPLFATRQVITDENGIATFELQNVLDLSPTRLQTTLYFGVFQGDNPIGKTAVTIKKGESKTITLRI